MTTQALRQSVLGIDIDLVSLLITLLGFVVPIFLAAFPPTRAMIARPVEDWRYRRWFTKKHREIHNIYSDGKRPIKLDLDEAYVPLIVDPGSNFRTARSDEQLVATKVITRSGGCIIITGDAGSGKSTLLKAYGVGVSRRRGRDIRSDEIREIRAERKLPILVLLRHFAAEVAVKGDLTIAEFIVEHILKSGASLRIDPKGLLRSRLAGGRCLVMLDGLDEVPSSLYSIVRDKILTFINDASDALPTHRAKVVITCRSSNFDDVRRDWARFASDTYTLLPFGDHEIRRYLERMRSSFVVPKTPELYLRSVMASGTLDMHRTPLILAMSVGLYTTIEDFEIPTSISELYREMIEALLDRPAFRVDAKGAINQFTHKDKKLILRKFVLREARRNGRIDDFRRYDLLEYSRSAAPTLASIPESDVENFVDEIIFQSGLIREKADGEGVYYFEHRSMQEYLVAEELAAEGRRGMEFLLNQAGRPAWRQTTLFYAAMGGDHLSEFMRALANTNLYLAAYCLAAAQTDVDIARQILHEVKGRIYTQRDFMRELPALLAIVRSPLLPVRDAAVQVVKDLLLSKRVGTASADPTLRATGDTTALVYVLQSVAEDRSPRTLELAAALAEIVPADARSVPPLWSCLDIPDVVGNADAGVVVKRLLMMATTDACLAELQNLPALSEVSFSDADRARAYPFRRGVPRRSNLVTLITWAVLRALEPETPYFRARREHGRALRRLEWAQRYTLRINFDVSGNLAWGLGAVGMFAAMAMIGFTVGFFGWGRYTGESGVKLLLALVPVGTAALVTLVHTRIADGRWGWRNSHPLWTSLAGVLALLYGVALLPFVPGAVLTFGLAAIVVPYVFVAFPITLHRHYFRIAFNVPPLNPLVDLYDDPGVRDWITRRHRRRYRGWIGTVLAWLGVAAVPFIIDATTGLPRFFALVTVGAVLLGWLRHALRRTERRIIYDRIPLRYVWLAGETLAGLTLLTVVWQAR
jgi:hypothetical protein